MRTTISPYRSVPRDSIVNRMPCLSPCAHTLRCQYAGIVPSCWQQALVMIIFLAAEHFAYVVVFQRVLSFIQGLATLAWILPFYGMCQARSTTLRAAECADHDSVWDRPWEGLPRRAHAPCSRVGADSSECLDPRE